MWILGGLLFGALVKEFLDEDDNGTPPPKEPEQKEDIGRWAYLTCKLARLEIQANYFGENYPSRKELIEYNNERKKCAPNNVKDFTYEYVGENDSPLAFSPLHKDIRWAIGAYINRKDKDQISKRTYQEAREINRIYRGLRDYMLEKLGPWACYSTVFNDDTNSFDREY